MANANLNQFMKSLVVAADKQEQRSTAKDSLKKQVLKVKRVAGSKRLNKSELKQELKELETRLNIIIEKEGDLVEAAEREHRTSQEIRQKITELDNALKQTSQRDANLIDSLKNQIQGLEHELRVTEGQRKQEVQESKAQIDTLKLVIFDLKDKVGQTMERERKVNQLEQSMRKKADDNRSEIEKIELELNQIKVKEKEPGFFARLKTKFHRKKDLDDFVKPAEKELFEQKIPEMAKPTIKPKPLVKHEMMFGDVETKRSIPKQEGPILKIQVPRVPKLMSEQKKGFFSRLFKK